MSTTWTSDGSRVVDSCDRAEGTTRERSRMRHSDFWNLVWVVAWFLTFVILMTIAHNLGTIAEAQKDLADLW